jgi:hypothetical protein
MSEGGTWPVIGMPTGYPDIGDVRAYIRVPATSLPDEDLTRMMITAATDQTARCNTDIGRDPDTGTVNESLAQAYLRRVQREVAGRNLPLGMVGVDSAEYGPTRIAADQLIDEHERPFVRAVLA